ncbi:MAG TPA: PD-(D/E)XK nuclease family protein [Steroidobacteraceae bacterium]|nr:PD-(D/E)XK nuclease family protein [Steroidobacteraceae bacterium]
MISLPQDVLQAIEQGETVVVPSRQRSEAVRLAYAADALARKRYVWQTPDVLPLEAWKAREIERRAASGEKLPRLLGTAEEWFLWRQAAAEHTDDLELVARGLLADSLRRASQLAHEYRISLARTRGAPGSEERLLADVHRSVAQRMRALGAATAAELAAELKCLGGARPLLAVGFTQETPSFTALAQTRSAEGCSTRMRIAGDVAHNETRAVLATDAAEELERIAEWCRERLDAQGDARLLVVAPGAPEARERLATLIAQSVDPGRALSGKLAAADGGAALVALEGGLPLSRAPLVAHALRGLAWLANGAEFAELSAWLCAPYWAIPETARAKLDLWLRERAQLEITPRELLGAFSALPDSLASAGRALSAQIDQALRELNVARTTPRQWSERFDNALAALHWPGDRTLDSDEEQTRARFTELLDDFGQLATVAGVISREEAVGWLAELASRTSFRPASGDALVTIAPQFADPIVRYDGVWVAGLHADVWPQPVQPDPFLPLDAQIAAGVPSATAAGRAAEAQALLTAWRASTPHLVLSAPLRAEDVQLAPSPLLETFLEKAATAEAAPSLWLPLRVRREDMTECIDDRVGTPWDLSVRVPSGTRSVELQNSCPFRAYGELRLGSSEMDGPEPGVAADTRGRLLHSALEKLWGVLKSSSGLLAHSSEALDALIARCVDEAAAEIMGPSRADARPAVNRRECRRAMRLIRSLCELERKRAPFTVRERELERTLRLAGAELHIRIDRVDELGTGGFAILDYKSGRAIPGDWYSDRPSHPQLLAYLAAVGDETVAMSTVSVTARDVRFDGIAKDASLLPKVRGVEQSPDAEEDAWTHWQREWRARIDRLAADFVAGKAPVDPRPKACEYCHVVSICRISDASATAVEQNIDE